LEGTQAATGAVVRTTLPTGLDVRDGLVDGRVVRLLTGLRADVDVTVDVVPTDRRARMEHFATGIAFEEMVARSERGTAFRLGLGDRALVTFEAANAKPLLMDEAMRLLDDAARVPPVLYDGPHAAVVERSLTVLRLLTYQPTGALIAGPTGDDRKAWLGDQAEAARLFDRVGWAEDADGIRVWLVRLLNEHDFPLPPVFSIDGQPESDEREWQVWAELAADAHGLDDPALWLLLRRAADWLAEAWPEAPDDRAKQAARRALDRIGRQAQGRNPLDLDAVAWRIQAKQIEVPEPDRESDRAPDPDPDVQLSVLELAQAERWEEAHDAMDRLLAQPLENEARAHLDLVAACFALANGPR
jgi:hypothetical protein